MVTVNPQLEEDILQYHHVDTLHLLLLSTELILITHQSTLPSESVVSNRQAFLERLSDAIRSRYGPQYTLHLFGSIAYGVSNERSDLDVSVVSTSPLCMTV
jgi:DNA polymerase sigma